MIYKLRLFQLTLVSLFIICSSDLLRSENNLPCNKWRYEIEPVAVGKQGTYLIKVWSYSRNGKLVLEEAKKNAVHCIIFKGFDGNRYVPGQKPLAPNPELEFKHEKYFQGFFSSKGNYQRFVSVAGDGTIAPGDRRKIGREYKIGIIVSVNVHLLRRELEEAGIIRSLGSGF